jgi:hypothetical protein
MLEFILLRRYEDRVTAPMLGSLFLIMFIWKKQSKNKTTKNGKNEEDEKDEQRTEKHQTTSIGIYIYID